MSFRNVYFD